MPRVVSLYLPNLSIDRLRIADRAARRERPADMPPPRPADPVPDPHDDPTACSVPRGGGWRPGARWARADAGDTPDGGADAGWLEHRRRKATARAAIAREIETLPLHQRPPMRELGRRSEAVDHPFRQAPNPLPFRPMPPDEGARDAGAATPIDATPPDRGGRIAASRAGPDAERPAGDRPRALAAPPRLRLVHAAPPDDAPAPLVTATRQGQRVTVMAVCPAARALGLAPGMALTQARALVSGLDVRDADPAGDAALLERLAQVALRRWTPTAAVSQGGDGLWLEIAGAAHLFGGEAAMARRILRFCARAGYEARIAVAGTAGAAHALARYGRGPLILCPTGGEAEAIAPLPPAALRLERAQVDAARRLGLDSIGALIASPRAPLGRRFGTSLLARLDQAIGRQGEPIETMAVFTAPAALLRFVEPIATADAIAAALGDAMARLVADLSARGLGARALRLACLRVDGAEQIVRIGAARATREADHLLRLLAMRIETIDPGFGIEAIRLTAIRTEPLAAQPIDGGLGGDPPPPDLAPLVDRIAGRIGAGRLYRLGAVESDVPERSVSPAAPLATVAEWPLGWARPARLLGPPEPLDHVLAELPDHPPRRFAWRGVQHIVTRGDGPERIHGEWWRRSGEADAVRDYYQVEDTDGARFWLYRRGDGIDPRTGDLSWHMHGIFG